MDHAAQQVWRIVCVREPVALEPSPFVSFVIHRPGSEQYELGAARAGLTPAAVVTLSAYVLDASAIRLFATALAHATDGMLLAEGPIPWSLRIEGDTTPFLQVSWAALVDDAERAAAAASARTADPSDWEADRSDV
jgi:hypothetical protein